MPLWDDGDHLSLGPLHRGSSRDCKGAEAGSGGRVGCSQGGKGME